MKVRTLILAGGEGTRLGVLTAKRAKPAVPFAGKYRIIDFPISNAVNSELFDVMIIAQYRPQSLIEHIGSGGPWDLNRDFTGGVRIYTPYRSRSADWFIGTADAVQQNFTFVKGGNPDLILILSGDHIYSMDYRKLIQFHNDHQADLTMATISVPIEEANRFGIVGLDPDSRVNSFVEKPANPPSNQANMGVYVFNTEILNQALWEDHLKTDSSHDFGKNIIPSLVNQGARVFGYPYQGYWMDVGTITSYWQAHMDLLKTPPSYDLYNRKWVIHTRTEERPPAKLHENTVVEDSLICDGCIIHPGASVIRSVLSPGVVIQSGAVVKESILLTDSLVGKDSHIERAVLDKRVTVGEGSRIGGITPDLIEIAMVGKNTVLPAGMIIEPGGIVGTDVEIQEISTSLVRAGEFVQTRRLPNEI